MKLYKKETGKEPYINGIATDDYIQWLELFVKNNYDPAILKWIKTMFKHAKSRKWDVVYFTFDLHGTISCPDYRKKVKKIQYYTYAKETLQLLSKREDIKMILWSSSYPEELEIYKKQFEKDDIIFDFVGQNPDITDSKGAFGYYEHKHYFNVLFEDKASFDPNDWHKIYKYFLNQKYRPKEKWTLKYKEDYHKK